MLCFNICDFYPSITDTLVQKTLNFGSEYSTILEDQIDMVTFTRKEQFIRTQKPEKGEGGVT